MEYRGPWMPGRGGGEEYVQNLYVMRHAEVVEEWQVDRWWDPPLSENGKLQAWKKGIELRKQSHINISRVICSPFLRCVETAAQVVAALCAVEDNADAPSTSTSTHNLLIDPSKLKVSIEIGLCEVLNPYAIRSQPSSDINWTPSKDIKWTLDRPDLEAILPAGTIDHTIDPVWQELPQWEETMDAAQKRYSNTFLALADKFPQENLLCVTHGVGVSVSAFKEDIMVYGVDYCAVLHSRRTILGCSKDRVEAKKFDVLTESFSSGIQYLTQGT